MSDLNNKSPTAISHYLNKFHRKDGLVEWDDGTKLWYQSGEFHRIHGPAIEYPDGTNYEMQAGLHPQQISCDFITRDINNGIKMGNYID